MGVHVRPGIGEDEGSRKRPLPATGDAARSVSIGVCEQHLVALRVVSSMTLSAESLE